MTSGMVFGWGGLRDVWRMPAYVREVNADPKELRALEDLQRARSRPEFNPSHVSAMTSLGFWYYYLVGALASWILPAPAMPLAYACAAWAMGTAGWAVMSCGRRVACSYWITTGSTVVAAVRRVVRVRRADGPRRAGRLRRRRDDHASLAPGRRVRKGRQAHNLPRGVAGPFGDARAAALSGAAMYKWAIDLDVYSPDPTTGEWRMDGEEFAFRLRRGVHSTWTKRGFAGFGDLDHFNSGSPPPRPGRRCRSIAAPPPRTSRRRSVASRSGGTRISTAAMIRRARERCSTNWRWRETRCSRGGSRSTKIWRRLRSVHGARGGGSGRRRRGGGKRRGRWEPRARAKTRARAHTRARARAREGQVLSRGGAPAADDDDEGEYDPKVLEEELRRAFATYDRDEDGKMARGEFRFAMSKAGLQYTADEFEKVWSTEFNGKPSLDFDDFARFVVKHDVEPPVALEHTGGHDATEL